LAGSFFSFQGAEVTVTLSMPSFVILHLVIILLISKKEGESLLFFFRFPHGNHVNQLIFVAYIKMIETAFRYFSFL